MEKQEERWNEMKQEYNNRQMPNVQVINERHDPKSQKRKPEGTPEASMEMRRSSGCGRGCFDYCPAEYVLRYRIRDEPHPDPVQMGRGRYGKELSV